jgi:putative ABC transport system permease protein
VILLAGPAFAISARRRTREFALMSANGATPAQIRRIVLAGGVIFGVIAAFIAIAIGVLAVFVGMPFLEGIYGYRSAGLQVLPLLQLALVGVAVTTGLLSALAAAISASRVNVVAALMGRTPGRKGSKRWMVVGLLMLAAGIASGLVGVSMWSLPLMSAAIILAQLGLVACTPALLAAMARLGRWLPLAPRMALREAGRNRGSAAPAIAAVLGVVAAGMVFSMIVTADAERKEQSQVIELQQGAVTLDLYDNGSGELEEGEEPAWESGLAESRTVLERHLDDLEITEIPMYSSWNGCTLPVVEGFEETAECSWSVTRPEEHQCSFWDAEPANDDEMREAVEAAREDPNCNENSNDVNVSTDQTVVSTDPTVVAAYTGFEGAQLDEAVAMLEGGGVLVADPLALTDEGTVVLEGRIMIWDEETGEGEEFDPQFLELPAMAVDDSLLGYNKLLLSPEAAEQMGQVPSVYDRMYLVETSTPVEGAVAEAIAADLETMTSGAAMGAWLDVTNYEDDFTFYMVLLVSGLCALVALGATAVSTGLIIAEQHKDMTTLGAVGAAPGLRKRFAMWQTVMIAAFGAGLGTVAGLIGYAMVQQALNRPLRFMYPFEVPYGWELPWGAMGVILVAVPVLAAIGALVFTRARLPSERRLT